MNTKGRSTACVSFRDLNISNFGSDSFGKSQMKTFQDQVRDLLLTGDRYRIFSISEYIVYQEKIRTSLLGKIPSRIHSLFFGV